MLLLRYLTVLLAIVNFSPLPYQTGKKQVPVLCYHNIKADTEGHDLDYTISREQLEAQIKMLFDSGYHTILPRELYDYLTTGAPLPPKPVMLSFDDSHEEHFSIAASILKKYGFKGVFFVMTVTIGKPGYMTAGQIKQLADEGHVIGSHTWDHPDVRKIMEKDWDTQLNKPIQTLERITGRPVEYFAYPFGAWNETAIIELKKRGVKAAFQLIKRQSSREPLYTIRRLMVSGRWNAAVLDTYIRRTFK